MIATSELEKLQEYRSLLEDIIELQKQVGHITQEDLDALAEYVSRLKEAADLSSQLREAG